LKRIKSQSNQTTLTLGFQQFEDILSEFNLKLNSKEKEFFINAFSLIGETNEKQIQIGVSKLVQIEKTRKIDKIYEKLNMEDEEDEDS